MSKTPERSIGNATTANAWRRCVALFQSLRPPFGHVRLALSALLSFAAVLKAEQLFATSPSPFTTATFWLVVFEFGFVAWLTSGLLPRLTWYLAGVCFGGFTVVAAAKVLSNESHCGCFGDLVLPPIVVLLIDAGVLLTLTVCGNRAVDRRPSSARGLGAVVVVVAASFGGIWASRLDGIDEVAPGLMMSGGYAMVDPSQWTPDMTFPLLPYIDIKERLEVGDWRVVFARHGCQECEDFMRGPFFATLATSSRVAVVEVSADLGSERVPPPVAANGRLRGSRHWFMTTPLVVTISGGTIINVSVNAV